MDSFWTLISYAAAGGIIWMIVVVIKFEQRHPELPPIIPSRDEHWAVRIILANEKESPVLIDWQNDPDFCD